MKTKLFLLGAVGLLGAGVMIHHSGHCPLMDAKNAMAKHASKPAVRAANPAPVVTAAMVDAK